MSLKSRTSSVYAGGHCEKRSGWIGKSFINVAANTQIHMNQLRQAINDHYLSPIIALKIS